MDEGQRSPGRPAGEGGWRRWDRDGETVSGDRIRVKARDWPTRKTADVCLPELCCGLNLHSLSQSQVSVYGEYFSSAVRRMKVEMSREYSCNFLFFKILSSRLVDQSTNQNFIYLVLFMHYRCMSEKNKYRNAKRHKNLCNVLKLFCSVLIYQNYFIDTLITLVSRWCWKHFNVCTSSVAWIKSEPINSSKKHFTNWKTTVCKQENMVLQWLQYKNTIIKMF